MEKESQYMLNKYRDNLLEVLRTEGKITDIDLSICMPKKEALTKEKMFLDAFNVVKKSIYEESKGHGSLSERSMRNLNKLIKRGFTVDDFTNATRAMYYGDSWARKTGNDVPEHILIESNFERYLNAYEKVKIEREAKAKVKQSIKIEIVDTGKDESEHNYLLECLKMYNEALTTGEWKGNVYHSSPIEKYIALPISQKEWAEMFAQAERSASANRNAGRSERGLTVERVMSELKVLKAIELKIKIEI